MSAPEKFARWMNFHEHTDEHGHVYRYHPRSNQHSIVLCEYIMAIVLPFGRARVVL
jgi:hypothetical protein